jgi:hypothetical protein
LNHRTRLLFLKKRKKRGWKEGRWKEGKRKLKFGLGTWFKTWRTCLASMKL